MASATTRVCNPPQVIPALTGQYPPGDLIQELIALPIYLGGLGLTNPLTSFSQIHTASKLIGATLVERVVHCPSVGIYSTCDLASYWAEWLPDITNDLRSNRKRMHPIC